MTGEGADEILFGYDIFREQACIDFIKKKSSSKWRYNSLDSLYSYLPQFKNPRYRKLAIEFLMRDAEYSTLNPLKSRLSSNLRSLSIMSEDISDNFVQNLIDEYREDCAFNDLDDISKIQRFEIDNLLSGYLLSSQGDRVAMANSVESRFPYLDLEFVRYVNSIPREWMIKSTAFKRILKEAYKHQLPPEIVRSPKIAYQAPEARAILLNPALKQLLLSDSNPIFNIYSKSKTDRIINRVLQNTSARGSFSDNMTISILSSLSLLLNS